MAKLVDITEPKFFKFLKLAGLELGGLYCVSLQERNPILFYHWDCHWDIDKCHITFNRSENIPVNDLVLLIDVKKVNHRVWFQVLWKDKIGHISDWAQFTNQKTGVVVKDIRYDSLITILNDEQ